MSPDLIFRIGLGYFAVFANLVAAVSASTRGRAGWALVHVVTASVAAMLLTVVLREAGL